VITTFGSEELTAPPSGSVVSIGVFDGVHLGHRAILARNVERARELDASPTAITFQNHPKLLLLGHAPRTLTTLDHRLELFSRIGIEHALVLDFDDTLRELSAQGFVERFARDGLGARQFVLGFDSKFGHGREGTPEFLTMLGYTVEVVERVMVSDRAVSSTAIREAVELGDLDGARAMLGRSPSVFGDVVRGDQLGRTLGFPTANLDLHHELHPPVGVYACRARVIAPAGSARSNSTGGEGEQAMDAVANIGFRPTREDTVAGSSRPTLPLVEVHLLDFEGDLYGAHLEVEFLAHLRGEARFDGLDALKVQIARDVEAARAVLG